MLLGDPTLPVDGVSSIPQLPGQAGSSRLQDAPLDSWNGFPTSQVVVRDVKFGVVGELPPSRRRGHGAGGEGISRTLDVILATALLIFFLPVVTAIAILVFCTDPGPIFFAHKRQGKHGQAFKCLKFRTMVTDAEHRLQELLARDPEARGEWELDHKLRNDPRVTPLGNFLRRSSLDELPQLWNVLRGDMSLVGPRPIVAAEVNRYGRYIEHYYRIRPGITGLWQVSGRNNTTYRRRVAMDIVYARRKSTVFNIRILFMTLPSVLKSKGAF